MSSRRASHPESHKPQQRLEYAKSVLRGIRNLNGLIAGGGVILRQSADGTVVGGSSRSLLRERHFRSILALFVASSVFYYLDSFLDLLGVPNPHWGIFYTVHDFHRLLFAIPVLYSAYAFGLRGAVAVILLTAIAFLPRALYISPYPDSMARPLAYCIALGATALLVARLRNAVSAYRVAETALRESEEEYRNLVSNLNGVVIMEIDSEGKFAYVSPQIMDMFGYAPEEAIGLAAFDFVHPDDIGTCLEAMTAESETMGLEYRSRHKDGSYVYVSTTGKRVPDGRGGTKLVSIATDITERKRAEAALRESEEEYRSLFEQSMDAITLVEVDGSNIKANQSWLDLFGYSLEELPNLNIVEVYANPDDRKDFLRRIAQAEVIDDEVRFKKKDGTAFDCARAVTVRRNERGNVVAFQGIMKDVTEQKRKEREKVERQKELECLYEVAAAAERRRLGLDVFLRSVTVALPRALQYPAVASARLVLDGQEYLSDGYREGQWKESAAILVGREVRGLVEVAYSEPAPEEDEGPFLQAERTLLAAVAERVGITVERARAEEQLLESHAQLERVLEGTLDVIQQMAEVRDPYVSGHQRRVAELSVAVARQMGLPEESCVSLIRTAALIHDIGKMVVPAEILSKPGKLTSAEFELVKSHAQTGYDILTRASLPDPVPEVVLQHHERLDGSGYPQGLSGDDILPEAQILAVADVVEAMSSHRPYRPALGTEAALEEIEAGSGTRFYPDVVEACRAVFRKGFAFSS